LFLALLSSDSTQLKYLAILYAISDLRRAFDYVITEVPSLSNEVARKIKLLS